MVLDERARCLLLRFVNLKGCVAQNRMSNSLLDSEPENSIYHAICLFGLVYLGSCHKLTCVKHIFLDV